MKAVFVCAEGLNTPRVKNLNQVQRTQPSRRAIKRKIRCLFWRQSGKRAICFVCLFEMTTAPMRDPNRNIKPKRAQQMLQYVHTEKSLNAGCKQKFWTQIWKQKQRRILKIKYKSKRGSCEPDFLKFLTAPREEGRKQLFFPITRRRQMLQLLDRFETAN
jgi:hypothetical protein